MNIKNTFLVTLVLSSSLTLPMMASAQVKHKTAKAVAAGVAAYEIAKHTGKNKAHKNFMQKHPVLTGVAAAAIVHHKLKKHH